MRAVVTTDYGSPAEVMEVPDRQAGPDEVLVRVSNSSINGFDLAVAGGALKGVMHHEFPVVLGRDFSGVVEESQSEHFKTGDRVFGTVARGLGADGAFAELVALPAGKGVAPMPEGLASEAAGAIAVAGLAAQASVDALGAVQGKTVLVSGATGGVGAFAIQLLAAAGADVIATARPGDPADFVLAQGASAAVDYSTDLQAQVRDIAPGGVDGVIHLAGDPIALADLLVEGGHLASTLGVGPDAFEGRGIVATAIMAPSSKEALSAFAALVAAGSIKVPITRTYALEEVPNAIQEFAGALGKAAVDVGSR